MTLFDPLERIGANARTEAGVRRGHTVVPSPAMKVAVTTGER